MLSKCLRTVQRLATVSDFLTVGLWSPEEPAVNPSARQWIRQPMDSAHGLTVATSFRAVFGSVILFPEPLEPIRQLRPSFALVGELGDEQRKRLGVPGNP
jgi:hypothetical protein